MFKVLPMMRKCGFNHDSTAIDYLLGAIMCADKRWMDESEAEKYIDNRIDKKSDEIMKSLNNDQREALNAIIDMKNSLCSLERKSGFTEGFKLGLRLGAECFEDDSLPVDDIYEKFADSGD